jgi:hypothetical protein
MLHPLAEDGDPGIVVGRLSICRVPILNEEPAGLEGLQIIRWRTQVAQICFPASYRALKV